MIPKPKPQVSKDPTIFSSWANIIKQVLLCSIRPSLNAIHCTAKSSSSVNDLYCKEMINFMKKIHLPGAVELVLLLVL